MDDGKSAWDDAMEICEAACARYLQIPRMSAVVHGFPIRPPASEAPALRAHSSSSARYFSLTFHPKVC